MMGIGSCLTEEFVVEGGMVVTDHLSRYRMPGILLTPEITSIVVEHPVAGVRTGPRGLGRSAPFPRLPPSRMRSSMRSECGLTACRLTRK